MNKQKIAAIAATVTLLFYVVLQIALIFGAPFGHFAWGGQYRVLPTELRIASSVSLLIYSACAIIALSRARLWPTIKSERFLRIACWVLGFYFLLGVAMNAISPSPIERWNVIGAGILAISFFVLARNK